MNMGRMQIEHCDADADHDEHRVSERFLLGAVNDSVTRPWLFQVWASHQHHFYFPGTDFATVKTAEWLLSCPGHWEQLISYCV